MIPRRKEKKLETVINNCASLIKQHLKKIAEITQNIIFSLGAFKILQEKWNSLLDLGNKLYDIEKFFDFILCHVLLKIVLFY